MEKAFIFISIFLIFSVSANNSFDSSTEEKITSIYWITPDDTSAIVYAQFEMFEHVRSTITNAIMVGNNWKTDPKELQESDKLLLMLPSDSQIIEVHLMSNAISYEG